MDCGLWRPLKLLLPVLSVGVLQAQFLGLGLNDRVLGLGIEAEVLGIGFDLVGQCHECSRTADIDHSTPALRRKW